MHTQNLVLPAQDIARLKEIAKDGTLEGNDDQRQIVKYLASALAVVAEGQIDGLRNLQKVLDTAGLGR